MANRFPLVLDTTDNNKIKEIPESDNLDLRTNSIVNVQNITSLGTIDAQVITVDGQKLVAQSFADLTDTPNTFSSANNYFVKVNSTATGLEFRPLSDLGTIEIDTINVDTAIVPSTDGVGNIGTEANKFNEIVGTTLKGNLVSYNEEIVFDATTGKVSYAALQGAPQFLSEFTDDVGYLQTADLNSTLYGLFDEGVPFATDIKGSVFGDDSTVLVDSVASKIRGDIEFTSSGSITGSSNIVINATTSIDLGDTQATGNIYPDAANTRSIGTVSLPFGEGNFDNLTSESLVTNQLNYGTGLGIAQMTAATDLEITAGNRVKINGNIPFRISSVTDANLGAIGAENGDLIYNSTTNRLIMYQNNVWQELNGNVLALTGTSNFNDVVIGGNLTVQGTTTSVDTTNTTISDNVITLNDGEVGAGVTAITSGIEIDRGTESNVSLVWDDSVDKWTVGSEILTANAFESVAVRTSIVDNNGGPLQIKAGLTTDSGNTIFINPYGSDTLVQMWGETVNLVTGPYNTYDSPYMQFKTAGAFKAHQGAYFDGNLVGDVTGSVFADDSSAMVDAVGNEMFANTATFNTTTSTNIVGTNINPVTGQSITVGGSLGSISYNDTTGAIQIASTGPVSIEGAALGAVSIGSGTSGTVTLGNGINTVAFVSGTTLDFNGATISNFSGDIDKSTITIGGTTATAINIGNSGSTTTIDGTVSFASALVANNITADDSIQITTAVGNNNGITINPLGTNTSINLLADELRLFGTPITDNLKAVGGLEGDLIGSVFGSDSAMLVDGLDSKIVGDIDSTNIYGVSFRADTIVNNTGTTIDLRADGFMNIYGGDTDAGVSNIQMDKQGINHIELKTEPGNPADPTDYARIAINASTDEGDVRIGTPISTRNQVVEIFNMTASGTLTGTVTGTVTGNLVGDVTGSVYADDSSLIIDGVNGTIPGYISITQLQSIAAGAGTYADFQAAIAAL